MKIQYLFVELSHTINEIDIESINRLLIQLNGKMQEIKHETINTCLKNSHLLIARDFENKNMIIGMACLACCSTLQGNHGRIEDVVVDTRYRKNGIGFQLIQMLIEKAKQQNYIDIWLTSRPSRKDANDLYRKMGFIQHETNVYKYSLE